MAITLITSVAGSAGNGDPLTLSLGTVLENDIIVTSGGFSGETATAPGALGPTGFTSVWTVDSTALDTKTEWLRAGATPPTSVLLAGSGTATDATAYVAFVIRGVDTGADPLDTPVRTSVATGVPQAPSIITTTDGAAVLALGANDIFDSTPGLVTNFQGNVGASSNDNDDISAAGASSIIATAGTISPTAWTTWGSGVYNTITIALKPFIPPPAVQDPYQSFAGVFSVLPKRFRNIKV